MQNSHSSDPESELLVNGRALRLQVPPAMPLLWALRDVAKLTGTKYGCGVGLCGACTVHLDGRAVRSCVTPVSGAVGKQLTTIEGVGADALGKQEQQAWRELDVPQCGYCQPGQIMAATALLRATPRPSDSEIEDAMSGNICRCGTYQRIRAAIRRVAGGGTP